MPKAMINITDRANRMLNIIKAKYSLKDKSQAINRMTEEFGQILLEPQLRPEYIKKLRKIEKEGTISEEDFEKKFKVKI